MTDISRAIASAIAAFREAAVAKAEFATPSAKDHELHAAMATAWRLCRSSDEGIRALRELLEDSNDYVRCWVAAGLLSIGEVHARSTLEVIAQRSDLLGFNAQIVLQEFEAGRLRSPFDA